MQTNNQTNMSARGLSQSNPERVTDVFNYIRLLHTPGAGNNILFQLYK